MTEEEKAVLRRIAETTKRIVEQQHRIERMTGENRSTDMAVERLCAGEMPIGIALRPAA